jgi:ABC-type molybdate transport system substrate-binding protein
MIESSSVQNIDTESGLPDTKHSTDFPARCAATAADDGNIFRRHAIHGRTIKHTNMIHCGGQDMKTSGSKLMYQYVLMLALLCPVPGMSAEDADLNHDYRTFRAGDIAYGNIGDSYTADLVMYLAGNQFMVMEDLIGDFQSKHPEIKSIYVETIPPGQILKQQLLAQGQINGQDTARNPDLYASVNLGHLKKLKGEGMMSDYMIYTHNKLELMVAEGNPEGIKGPGDLARDDLVQSHPNPLTEGIFKFYGAEMLHDLGIYEKVTGNAQCKSCWAVPGRTWFTSRHHRETPDRIENGEADVGIVWTTEVVYAKKSGRKVDGVTIPAPYNKQNKVAYAIGPLKTGRNADNAARFLDYLATDAAQDIYARHGFLKASPQELTLKPIPEK